MDFPDQDFFNACAEGNEDYLHFVIDAGVEFNWGRLFTFRFISQEGEEIEV